VYLNTNILHVSINTHISKWYIYIYMYIYTYISVFPSLANVTLVIEDPPKGARSSAYEGVSAKCTYTQTYYM